MFIELSKDYISGLTLSGGDPLNESNLNGVLELVNEIRLLFPEKTIWLYSGYTWKQIMYPIITDDFNYERDELINKRIEIVKQCDVLIDGKYIASKKDISLKWRGSSNQHVIDIKQSLQQNKVVLYCE